jgi:acetate kinase
MKEALPNLPHVAVFDTAFHQTMPPEAFLYAIPYAMYQKHKVRRYGFHGSSHRYMIFALEKRIVNKPRSEFRAITIHLGNGCSMAAVDGGKSIDTSMGFTPLEGLIMGTRSGDVDPAAILYLIAKEEITLHETNTMLNKFSGLTALSGTSNDVRELTKLAEAKDERAQMALRAFAYRCRKYLGSYHAALGGANYIAVAGGIGENSALVRKMIFEGLDALGIQFDQERNEQIGPAGGEITKPSSPVRAFVVRTDEELVIARDTVRCVSSNSTPST